MTRSMSCRTNRGEVKDLLSRMEKQIDEGARKCVHGHPFFKTIAKIPSE